MTKEGNTIFAKIIRKEIPADIVFENERVLAFKDLNPQAPVHVLIVPKKAISKVSDSEDADQALLGELILVARDLAKEFGFNKGFRLVINDGEDGGQSVAHLHVHLLGGRAFDWPPG